MSHWEPIESAPEDERIILAFAAVCRPRKLGEKKQSSAAARKLSVKHGKDFVKRDAFVTAGIRLNGQWVPGRRSPHPFFDDPIFWMRLPALPDALS